MISVVREGGLGFRFTLKFSAPGTGWRSWKVKAKDTHEVKLAVEHYYGEKDSNLHNNFSKRGCPLCRDCKEKADKEKRKR